MVNRRTDPINLLPVTSPMTITEKIGASIRHSKACNKNAHIADFQIRVREDRVVLLNLKTGDVEVIEADTLDYDLPQHSIVQ